MNPVYIYPCSIMVKEYSGMAVQPHKAGQYQCPSLYRERRFRVYEEASGFGPGTRKCRAQYRSPALDFWFCVWQPV